MPAAKLVALFGKDQLPQELGGASEAVVPKPEPKPESGYPPPPAGPLALHFGPP